MNPIDEAQVKTDQILKDILGTSAMTNNSQIPDKNIRALTRAVDYLVCQMAMTSRFSEEAKENAAKVLKGTVQMMQEIISE